MQYFAVVDCGTTNSSMYVLDSSFQTIAMGKRKVGVTDTTVSGYDVFQHGLTELFYETVERAGLQTSDISFLVAFGMITSELGLLEVPHLWAPAGMHDLVQNIKVVRDPRIFPPDVPVVFVRGIKNRYGEEVSLEDIRSLDFLRGEETQIMGFLHNNPDLKPPFTVVVFSSHTKYVRVEADGSISGSMTTLSGQVFEAIASRSAVAKSVSGVGTLEFDPATADLAREAVRSSGFLRAVLMPRFIDVLVKLPAAQNRLFLTAAIVAEDMESMLDFPSVGFGECNDFVLLGHEDRCRCFKYFLEKYHNGRVIKQIHEQEELDRLNIQGAAAIVGKANLLGKV